MTSKLFRLSLSRDNLLSRIEVVSKEGGSEQQLFWASGVGLCQKKVVPNNSCFGVCMPQTKILTLKKQRKIFRRTSTIKLSSAVVSIVPSDFLPSKASQKISKKEASKNTFSHISSTYINSKLYLSKKNV